MGSLGNGFPRKQLELGAGNCRAPSQPERSRADRERAVSTVKTPGKSATRHLAATSADTELNLPGMPLPVEGNVDA